MAILLQVTYKCGHVSQNEHLCLQSRDTCCTAVDQWRSSLGMSDAHTAIYSALFHAKGFERRIQSFSALEGFFALVMPSKF